MSRTPRNPVVHPSWDCPATLPARPSRHWLWLGSWKSTASAVARLSSEGLAEVKRHLDAMREASEDVERLNAHDAAFHRAIVSVTGNESLLTLLEGVSGRTLRARIWRGLVDTRAAGRTLAEHEAIYAALAARDAALAHAAALPHVANTEQWLREHLRSAETPGGDTSAAGPVGESRS